MDRRPLARNQNLARCQQLLPGGQEPDKPVLYVKVKLPEASNINAARIRYPDRLPAASPHPTLVPVVDHNDSASEQGDEPPRPRKKQRGKGGKGRQYPTTSQPDPTELFDENDPGMTVTIWPDWLLGMWMLVSEPPFPPWLLRLDPNDFAPPVKHAAGPFLAPINTALRDPAPQQETPGPASSKWAQ